MTEAEWRECGDPCQLLAYLHRLLSNRKLLLYGVACCHAHWHLLTQPVSREAVGWVDRYADGEVERDEGYARLEYKSEGAAFRMEHTDQVRGRTEWFDDPPADARRLGLAGQLADVSPSPSTVAAYFANALMTLDTHDPYDSTLSSHRSLLLVPLLRDIFGNPFRPVTFSPSWRTGTAVSLARGMYESREFSAMPILADALQDAGCDSDEVLNHCRQPGEHVRGCWVIDLVLGRE